MGKNPNKSDQTLHLLEPGEGVVTKRTPLGFYVDMPYQKGIFIYYTETLTEAIFDDKEESTDDN